MTLVRGPSFGGEVLIVHVLIHWLIAGKCRLLDIFKVMCCICCEQDCVTNSMIYVYVLSISLYGYIGLFIQETAPEKNVTWYIYIYITLCCSSMASAVLSVLTQVLVLSMLLT